MPSNLLLYLLLVLAIGIGFALGRSFSSSGSRGSNLPDGHFYEGLNYLLNDQPDLAVDALMDQLGMDHTTVDTYLALGALLRRRGEVDKAINVHQNLLAQPDMAAAKRSAVELELASDYLSAGLLGRAETLLTTMIERLRGQRGESAKRASVQAQLLLVGLYERESDWSAALRAIEPLVRSDAQQALSAAHYCCEIAESQLVAATPDFAEAEAALAQGRKLAPNCARLALVAGKLILARSQTSGDRAQQQGASAACQQFDQALQLEPDLAVDLQPLYRHAAECLGDTARYAQFLAQALPNVAAAPVSLLLEQSVLAAQMESEDVAQQLLLSKLGSIHSVGQLRGLLANIDPQQLAAALPAGLQAQLVQHLEPVAAKQPEFKCSNCGFGSSTRHWRCPSCQQWGLGRAVS